MFINYYYYYSFLFLIIQSISSSICKLPERTEIYNCTLKNTKKVAINIIIIIINDLSNYYREDGGLKIN